MTRKNDAAIIRRENGAIIRRPEVPEEFVTPAADIFETGNAFVVRLDMPGAERESIQVIAEGNELRVKARVPGLHKEQATLIYNEIVRVSYFRRFNLTPGIDTGRIGAEFEDGVLTVTIPKSDHATSKEIRIQ